MASDWAAFGGGGKERCWAGKVKIAFVFEFNFFTSIK